MTRVVAQGTFDLLHPGHVHYLEDAATYGDELHVIVARRTNVTHKPEPILCARQRRDMVAALDAVDGAHLGDPEDVFVPIERLDPDVIVLGFDQHHDEGGIAEALAARDIDCRVERASGREPRYEDELLSSGDIVDRILRRRGEREVDSDESREVDSDESREVDSDESRETVDATRDGGEQE